MDIFGGNHWLIIAFLAPMFWALVNIIDVYFVDGVYQDEYDGTIISALFQILPIIAILFLIKNEVTNSIAFFGRLPEGILLLAVAGGFLVTVSYFFYFKALFNKNDAALLQILWSLTIIAVPIISFIFLKEELSFLKYAGMMVTLAGVIMLSLNEKIKSKFSVKYIVIMLMSVVFLSLGMVFQERVYSGLVGFASSNLEFLAGFLFFSIGGFLGGIFFIFCGRRNPFPLIKKYLHIFIIAEGIQFFGTLASQRAIDIAPSVSYVATVETFVPVFILIFSLVIITLSKLVKFNKDVVKKIYEEQLDGIWIKVFATILMAIGIYIIS